MNGEGRTIADPAPRTPPLVFTCIAAWIVAAGFTGVLGAWVALRIVTASLVPTLVAHLVWDLLVLFSLTLDSI